MSTDTEHDLLPMDVSSRIGALRALLPSASCDALVITKSENVRYLTGFTGSAGVLYVDANEALLTTDGRYGDQAPTQIELSGAAVSVFIGRPDAQYGALGEAARHAQSIGLEASSVSWAQKTRFSELFSVPLVATTRLVESLRVVKDDGELARLERACAIADVALAQVKERFSDEITESEFAAELEFEMRRRGASAPAFETIVASGPNSALPHARPTDRKMVQGDLVVIDFGATVDGYRSDMTRTVSLGTPDRETAQLVEAVLAAQRAALAALVADVAAGEIDKACRTSLEEAGLGELFTHSTGHGVGLEIHEAPAVSPGSVDSLPTHSVIAVEPGAYRFGRGGVRMEDTVVVTPEGGLVLTHTTKDYVL